MAYVNYDEIIIRHPLLKSWGKNETEVNSDLLYYAEQYVNGRLAPFYDVPFTAAGPTVKDLTMDVAYANALWYHNAEEAQALMERVDEKISQIGSGTLWLITASGTTLEPMQDKGVDVWSNAEDFGHPVFSMLDAENEYSSVSSARIEYEEDERK